MVPRRVIRAVAPPTTPGSPSQAAIDFTDVTRPARFDCRFDLLLGILKAPYCEDTLVHRRNSAPRPDVGAIGAAGVGQTAGQVFVPPGEAAFPLRHRRQRDEREFSPARGFQAGSSHPRAPTASHSREENQRPGEHDSGAPMLCGDTTCRPGRVVRNADYGWAQPVSRTPLPVLPLSHIFIL
jgi:hypothetical protein